jgi:hypothetical protein
MSHPPGWYDAPEGDGRQRFWNGEDWTAYYAAPRGRFEYRVVELRSKMFGGAISGDKLSRS